MAQFLLFAKIHKKPEIPTSSPQRTVFFLPWKQRKYRTSTFFENAKKADSKDSGISLLLCYQWNIVLVKGHGVGSRHGATEGDDFSPEKRTKNASTLELTLHKEISAKRVPGFIINHYICIKYQILRLLKAVIIRYSLICRHYQHNKALTSEKLKKQIIVWQKGI